MLECRTGFQGYGIGDWPEVAVSWCRSEGCTAPLRSEVPDYDETDSDDDGNDQDDDLPNHDEGDQEE